MLPQQLLFIAIRVMPTGAGTPTTKGTRWWRVSWQPLLLTSLLLHVLLSVLLSVLLNILLSILLNVARCAGMLLDVRGWRCSVNMLRF